MTAEGERLRDRRTPAGANGMITFELGKPPRNWENSRLHWAVKHREMQQWVQKTVVFAHTERVVARWPKATAKTRARVTVRCYRLQLMDDGGASASIKPIVDALQVEIRGKSVKLGDKHVAVRNPGAGLIWNDDPEHCVLTPPGSSQVKVQHRNEERTVVEVEWL